MLRSAYRSLVLVSGTGNASVVLCNGGESKQTEWFSLSWRRFCALAAWQVSLAKWVRFARTHFTFIAPRQLQISILKAELALILSAFRFAREREAAAEEGRSSKMQPNETSTQTCRSSHG